MGEKRGLEKLVERFSGAMLEKLKAKRRSGYTGWDRRIPAEDLERRLADHMVRAIHDPKQWVDVANFAAFLWYRDQGGEEDGE